MEIQKIKYLENEKSFLDEIKTTIVVFEGLSFGEKSKFVKKIANTSFKEVLCNLFLISDNFNNYRYLTI